MATNGANYTAASTSYGSGIGSGDNFNTVFIGKSKTSDAIGSGRMFNGTFHEAFLFIEVQTASVYNCIESNMGTEFNVSGAKKEDGTVRTWYDQSGNNRHAQQTTLAEQPRVVNAGALLVDSAGLPEIEFTNDGYFDVNFGSNLSQPNSIFMVHQSDGTADTTNEFFDEFGTNNARTLLDVGSGKYRPFAGIAVDTGVAIDTNKNLAVAIYNGSSSLFAFSEGTGNFYDGTMQEFIVYNSDQTDNRTALESNIAEHYSIALPAGFDSGNNTVNGFVTTWYDQSGNGLHAEQTVAVRQPIIVENGTFQNGIKFTHTDTTNGKRLFFFKTTAELGTEFALVWVGTYSGSSGFVKNVLGATRNVQGYNPGAIGLSIRPTSNNFRFINEQTGTNRQVLISTQTLAADTLGVVFASYDDDSALISVNGTANTSTFSSTVLTNTRVFNIMNSTATNGTYRTQESPEGIIREAIVFDTNQVNNRTAIEANVASHYNIT